MGMCLISLAWVALWLRSPYGRVLNMFGMGRPMASAALYGHVLNMFGMGQPYGCGHPMGVCLLRLAWAALWLRPPYGCVLDMFGRGRPIAAVSLWACA